VEQFEYSLLDIGNCTKMYKTAVYTRANGDVVTHLKQQKS